MLQARNISKSFGATQALSGVSLTLRGGEICALMGENGAGKSTLIKVLTGVYPADSGTIEFEGKNIQPRSPREAEASGISTVYQEINLIPTLSVADNISLGRQPTRCGLIHRKAIRQRAAAALGRLGLHLDVNRSLGTCSMAEQQLVAIARALDVQAKLLILDEPTSSLDEREVNFLFGILRQLRAEGLALLFVTHFLDQVYALADRITVLRNGTLVGEFPTPELPRLKLIEAMLGRELVPAAVGAAPAAAALKTGRPPAFLTARGMGKKGVLKPLDLELAPGEVVGLAGLLGSGRTETAKLLFGILRADSGEVSVDGKTTRMLSPRTAVRHGLGFCSEDRKNEGIIPHLSVRENLLLALQARRGVLGLVPRAEQERLLEEYWRVLEIKAASPETPIMHLSGGNQQKVLLARWLALTPKLILLDEPTRGIDVGAKAEIEKLVRALRDQGVAVLFISSDLEELVRNCQRVVVLRDRQKVGELAGAEVEVNRIMRMIAHHVEIPVENGNAG